MTPAALADLIRAKAGPGRFITAIAGPPGAGKSTLSAALAKALGADARVVPMDGFHFDDAILNARGLRSRKGAPETFDAAGFVQLMRRLRAGEEAAIPLFDRDLELSRAAADIVAASDRFLLVEGNWLLLDEAPWDGLAPLFDLTVMLEVPDAEIDRRLQHRWASHGKSPEQARAWIDGNDLPNVRRVREGSRPADLVIAG